MMNLLKFILPIKHDYYKKLKTNQSNESLKTMFDKEDYLYH